MIPAARSFRDPENAAFEHGGVWYRIAGPESASALSALRDSDVYDSLTRADVLVRFDALEGSNASRVLEEYTRAADRALPEGARVFEVETVSPITYPWEWPNACLQAAGSLTLQIREELLGIGLDLKDASAFNIQFRGMRPVLLDIGSVEHWRPNPSWNAARQYIEHFINPLAVGAGDRVTASDAWELSRRRGLRSEVARPLMPRRLRRRPSLWVLQASTKPRADHAPAETKYAEQARQRPDLALRATLSLTRRLAKHTHSLRSAEHSTTWQGYGDREHYSAGDLQRKLDLTRTFIRSVPGRERLVLDVGGNDGLTGRDLVETAAASVIVMDSDAGALDVLSRASDTSEDVAARLTPLLGDLTNLTAASGLLDGEFSAFVDRVRPSAVLCQAVLHHVVITQAVPMRLAVAALAQFGAPVLVEFATEDDPKVAILRDQIPNWTGDYCLETVLAALREEFEDVQVAGYSSATRAILTTGNAKGPR